MYFAVVGYNIVYSLTDFPVFVLSFTERGLLKSLKIFVNLFTFQFYPFLLHVFLSSVIRCTFRIVISF